MDPPSTAGHRVASMEVTPYQCIAPARARPGGATRLEIERERAQAVVECRGEPHDPCAAAEVSNRCVHQGEVADG